jgi:CHASE2 domain-containing sensor protein
MNSTQLPFLVEGILMLMAGIFGILLGKAGKPYGKVKVAIHLFLYTWLAVGFAFILYGLSKIDIMSTTWIPVAMMGLMILIQPVTGILLLASKKAGKALPKIHMSSAIPMILSDVCAFIIAGLRS